MLTRRSFFALIPAAALPAASGSPAGGMRPIGLAFQPRPVQFFAGAMPFRGGHVTAITRVWAEGDAARCRLCARCTASDEGVCQIQVNFKVDAADAAMFDARALAADERGGAR